MFHLDISPRTRPRSPTESLDTDSEHSENMEPHGDSDDSFTNFSIAEILKPDFGRKSLTTGVLDLSRDSVTYSHSSSDSYTCYNWAARLQQQFGLTLNAFSSRKHRPTTNTIPYLPDSHCQESSKHGLKLDVKSHSRQEYQDVHDVSVESPSQSDRHNESCGSDGESVNSSPSTSPASSPHGSPPGGAGAKPDGAGKLWPAWVYCTRYSDRPSAGKSQSINSH